MAETVHFSLRLRKDIKAELEKRATADKRSVGNLMEMAIEEFLGWREPSIRRETHAHAARSARR
jgi:predicted transcriptional regulator